MNFCIIRANASSRSRLPTVYAVVDVLTGGLLHDDDGDVGDVVVVCCLLSPARQPAHG